MQRKESPESDGREISFTDLDTMIDVMLLEDHFSATSHLSCISTGTRPAALELSQKKRTQAFQEMQHEISILDIMSEVLSIHIDI